MRARTLFLALGVMWTLLGCAQATPTPTEPAPVASPTIGTPTPTLLSRDHTPKPDLGVVEGTLVLDGQPPPESHMMYLARVIKPQGEDSLGVAALDPVNDPRAETDASGYFVFLDVPPGQYGLGIMSPSGPVLIRGGNGSEILSTVQAGQSVDLGDIHIVPFGQ